MIYGYLRASSDEQDANSQKQGVAKFAETREWKIDEYITDEGVNGAAGNIVKCLKQQTKTAYGYKWKYVD